MYAAAIGYGKKLFIKLVPGSQPLEIAGRVPFMWAQALYIVGRLLKESLVALGEIDPMNRRLGIQTKPEVIVQVGFHFRWLWSKSSYKNLLV